MIKYKYRDNNQEIKRWVRKSAGGFSSSPNVSDKASWSDDSYFVDNPDEATLFDEPNPIYENEHFIRETTEE